MVSRVLLRQRLKCRSFSWYLREVFPDQLRPERDFVGYGQVSHSVPHVDIFQTFSIENENFADCEISVRRFEFHFHFHSCGYLVFDQVKGPGDTCLDTLGPGVGHQVGVYSCHGKGQNQVSATNTIKTRYLLLTSTTALIFT